VKEKLYKQVNIELDLDSNSAESTLNLHRCSQYRNFRVFVNMVMNMKGGKFLGAVTVSLSNNRISRVN
jgi:hypothetical protein